MTAKPPVIAKLPVIAKSPVIVVGAGIVGVAAALFLQEDGHAVVLVDPRSPGSGTSSGNAGIIALSAATPIITPATLKGLPAMLMDPVGPLRIRWRHILSLAPWLLRAALATRSSTVERATAGVQALAAQAMAAHEVLIQRAGAGDFLRSMGWVKVALDAGRLARAVAAERPGLERFEIAHEVLDRDELLDLEPALSSGVAGGLWLQGNREISHPQRYIERLAALFLERGGRHLRSEARGLSFSDGRVDGILTTEGTVRGRAVVIAAGAFSRRLALAAGEAVPLEAERGYHLMLPKAEPVLGRPIYCMDPGFVLAPMDHGLRLTSGVELASLEAPPDFRLPRRILPLAKRYLPGIDERVESEWQGFRPSLPDSLPVIGRARSHANVILAFGHQHLGLTLGPVTGRIVADLVAEREPAVDLVPYRPDRRFF